MASPLLLSNPSFSFSHRPNNTRSFIFRNATSSSSSSNPIKIPNFKTHLLKNLNSSSKSLQLCRKIQAGASVGETEDKKKNPLVVSDEIQVGEDSASFSFSEQKISSWVYFTGILGVVLFALDVIWIDSSNGFGVGKAFVDSVSGLSESHEIVMLALILIFATVHSGMASLRDKGEKLIGERAFRVLFAGISLPLAFSTIPVVYVAESAISSGTTGISFDGAENTAAIVAGVALISIDAASTVLLQGDSLVAHFEYHKHPITSIEWSPHEPSTLAVASADHQQT